MRGDVFDLTVDELLGLRRGNEPPAATCAGWRWCVTPRARRYAAAPAPPNRFATRDLPVAPPAFTSPAGDGGARSGTPCCPGIVRGRARIVRDPRETLRPR